MTNQKNVLTVGELKRFLKAVAPETEITFGSSKYRKRPLVFNRFKTRGEKLLQIELNEIDQSSEPMSEIDSRPTAEYFLDQLKIWENDWEIYFGSSLDAVPLEFRSLTKIVAINLEQTNEPEWKVEGD